MARGALVTGGSRGIGRAAGLALARQGFAVAFNYRQDAAAAAESVRLASAAGATGIAVQGDVSDPEVVERVWAEASQALGTIDVLVNNAAIAPLTAIEAIEIDEWDQVFHTNVRGPFQLSRLALRTMAPRRWGRIVTMTSQAGITGGYFVGAHYSATKGALIALTRTLAKHGAAHGVTANCVAPGLVDTDLVAGFPADRREAMIEAIPMRRLGTPDEVGALVAFLASDAAGYITGATIPVDGGLLAG